MPNHRIARFAVLMFGATLASAGCAPISAPATVDTTAQPRSAPGPIDPRAEAALEAAGRAFDQNDLEAARRHLLEAAQYDSPQAHYNLGVMAQQEGRYDEAVERFERTLRLDPGYHAARLELGRMFADGWGVPRDDVRAAALMLQVADGASGRLAAVASANLGIFYLYGLGVEPSLAEARRRFESAAAEGSEEALNVLRQLPETMDVWGGAPLVAERPHRRSVVHHDDSGGLMRPTWATAELASAPPSSSVSAGVYAFESTVAVGAPDLLGADEPPGTSQVQNCLQVSARANDGPRFQMYAWGTNRDMCLVDATLIHRGNGGAVFFAKDDLEAIDISSGETVSVEGCFIRSEITGTSIRFVEDWPSGCSRKKCEPRAMVVGTEFELTPATGTCDERVGASAIAEAEAVVGPRPDWTQEPDNPPSGSMRAFQGVWRSTHTMPVYMGPEEPNSEDGWIQVDATDSLLACPTEDGEVDHDLVVWGVNQHSCNSDGESFFNADGDLVLVAPDAMVYVGGVTEYVFLDACYMRVRRQGDTIELTEVWPDYCYPMICGARAHPLEATFREAERDATACQNRAASRSADPD